MLGEGKKRSTLGRNNILLFSGHRKDSKALANIQISFSMASKLWLSPKEALRKSLAAET